MLVLLLLGRELDPFTSSSLQCIVHCSDMGNGALLRHPLEWNIRGPPDQAPAPSSNNHPRIVVVIHYYICLLGCKF
jgi:hypothetical protein